MPEKPTDPMDLPGDTYLVTPEMYAAVDPGLHPELTARVMREVRPLVAALDAKLAEIFGLEEWQVGVATLVQVHDQPWSVLTNLPGDAAHELIRKIFLQMAVMRLAMPAEEAMRRLMQAINDIPPESEFSDSPYDNPNEENA